MPIQCYTWWKIGSNKNKLIEVNGAYNMDKDKRMNEVTGEKIGKRIKQARINRGLTQEEMAEILDLSVTHYQNIEYGKYNIGNKHLAKICNLFNLSADYILFNKETTQMNFDVFYEKLLPEERIELLIKIISRIYKDKSNRYGDVLDEMLEIIRKSN